MKNKHKNSPRAASQVQATERSVKLETNKAIGYIRSATNDQKQLELQEQAIIEYANKEHFDLVSLFSHNFLNVRDHKKFLNNIISFCKILNINNIIIYSYDRISRDSNTSLPFIEKLSKCNIKLHAVNVSGIDVNEKVELDFIYSVLYDKNVGNL